MISRVQELCRKLKPVLGERIDKLWSVYIAESDTAGKAQIEQVLEMLAQKHLRHNFEPDHNPFPPPSAEFSTAGNLKLGTIHYGDKELYPFCLKSSRLKEHILVAGRSGSGKTNLTFVLMSEIIKHGIKVLALDWKRGYRNMQQIFPELKVYTVGRDVSPFRFNPLIPPPGCEPNVWIKMVVDVISRAYLGGEGVISLLVSGLDHLYRDAGVYDKTQTHWPTVNDLLIWLRTTKLKGRAAMWKTSAERILLAMMYGEFGAVINAKDNRHVVSLLDENVVLEMDGLSSSSDRVMFSEALTLYLYRYRLAQGPEDKLTNIIILEEAHNLLLKKSAESKESVLESSIRQIREYGLGFMFVDQSASMLSKVAFANSYATIALSQKLRSDIQTISGAMNLTDDQKQALNTLPVGSAVIRLADEYPEPFLVKVPLCDIKEGAIADELIRKQNRGNYKDSRDNRTVLAANPEIPVIPGSDENINNIKTKRNKEKISHPPSPKELKDKESNSSKSKPPGKKMSREEIRFLADVAARPTSTTVSRYQRLNISRRKGNAIRLSLSSAGIIEAVSIPTRSGQVMLYQLTDGGRKVCEYLNIDPGNIYQQSLQHRYWVKRVKKYFKDRDYDLITEYPVKDRKAIDLFAQKHNEKIAIEVETGKSDIAANLEKSKGLGFDKVILLAVSAEAVSACQKAAKKVEPVKGCDFEIMTWLDIS